MISLEWCRGQRSVNLNWESFVTIFDLHPPSHPQYPQYCTHNIWPQATHQASPPPPPANIVNHRQRSSWRPTSIWHFFRDLSVVKTVFLWGGKMREWTNPPTERCNLTSCHEDGDVRYCVISQISKLPVATFQATFGEDVKWVARRNVQNMTALGNIC